MSKYIIITSLLFSVITSCMDSPSGANSKNPKQVEDIDGNVYSTVKIGTQTWLASNLRVSKYRNGSAISNITSSEAWSDLTTGAWSHYNNQVSNEVKYGKLYNWYAVNDSRGLCPIGWRVPSVADWTTLLEYLSTDAGFKLKSSSGWDGIGNGSNSSGFNALPGGARAWFGGFENSGSFAGFWTSTNADASGAFNRMLYGGLRGISSGNVPKKSGYSVRCVFE
jgi:uncharacterized protein (TIGR02145 family)